MNAASNLGNSNGPVVELDVDSWPILSEYVSIDDPRIPSDLKQHVLSQVAMRREARHALVDPPHTVSCIVALLRHLFVSTPIDAEESCWSHTAEARTMKHARIEVSIPSKSDLRIRYGNRSDVWFAIHRKGLDPSYQLIADNFGRTTSVRPPDVPDDCIVDIQIPSEVPTALRDFLERLIARLDQSVPQEASIIAEHNLRRPLLASITPQQKELARRASMLYAARSGLAIASSSRCDHLISATIQHYFNFLIDGLMASDCILVYEIINQARPKFQYMIGEFVGENLEVRNQILNAFGSFQVGSVRYGQDWIKDAANVMQQRGKQLQQEALSASNFGQFYGKMYESCLWLRGAMWGHRYLAQSGADNSGEENIESNACEEWLAVGEASIAASFDDSMDGRAANGYRELIARERALNGEKAAEAFVTQIIEQTKSYPRFFRPSLNKL